MSKQTLEYLKTKFEQGDRPTQDDFYDLLDTVISGYSMDYIIDSPTLYSIFIIDDKPKVVQRLKVTTTDNMLNIKLISLLTGETVGEYTIQPNSIEVYNIDLITNTKIYAFGLGVITYSYIGG